MTKIHQPHPAQKVIEDNFSAIPEFLRKLDELKALYPERFSSEQDNISNTNMESVNRNIIPDRPPISLQNTISRNYLQQTPGAPIGIDTFGIAGPMYHDDFKYRLFEKGLKLTHENGVRLIKPAKGVKIKVYFPKPYEYIHEKYYEEENIFIPSSFDQVEKVHLVATCGELLFGDNSKVASYDQLTQCLDILEDLFDIRLRNWSFTRLDITSDINSNEELPSLLPIIRMPKYWRGDIAVFEEDVATVYISKSASNDDSSSLRRSQQKFIIYNDNGGLRHELQTQMKSNRINRDSFTALFGKTFGIKNSRYDAPVNRVDKFTREKFNYGIDTYIRMLSDVYSLTKKESRRNKRSSPQIQEKQDAMFKLLLAQYQNHCYGSMRDEIDIDRRANETMISYS